ncbi:VOC family protein [Amaricoccus sp.]|uniref:VOC family protein n=1 Tax=Amaricoccus sp. TaxID=1872485 RepID=UPI001B56E868|nr:VOC family protein [Amaricoccus sp.]MBP7001969.1 VOC family protein [Amaricoccus sp.]
MQIAPYLSFDGRCREAFETYARILGGHIDFLMTVGESPHAAESPPERQGDVMHARLSIAGRIVMGADAPPQWRSTPAGFSMSVNVADEVEGRRLFEALAEGGEVKAPYAATFWSRGFGMAIDRFGIPWMVNCDQPPA